MFNKILIANRGEIAVRIIRACREMDIRTVLVYSQADADSMAVRLADEAVCIGPARSAQSYLCIDRILSVSRLSASYLHPGYLFHVRIKGRERDLGYDGRWYLNVYD